MTASLATPVTGALRKLPNGTTECLGKVRPVQIAAEQSNQRHRRRGAVHGSAANTVEGGAVWRVNEVLIQPQGLEISSGCGSGQTGADQPGHIAGEEPRSR